MLESAPKRALYLRKARGSPLRRRLSQMLEARPVEGRRPASAFGPIEVMPVLK